MIKKIVKKLWQGKYCSIRDYEIPKAIKNGGMILQYKDEYMVIKPNELDKLKPTGATIQSNFKGSYRLIDIKFKADSNINQNTLF